MQWLERDLAWLIAEAREHPETAERILQAFAERVQALQRQADELRAENALLKRSGGQTAPTELAQRWRWGWRDLCVLAERGGLNRDVISLLSFSGYGVQLPAPAPIEQALVLATSPEEPIEMLKPIYLAAGKRLGSMLVATSSARLAMAFGFGLPLSERWDWRDARLVGELRLGRAERVEAMCAVDELNPPHDMLLVTRQGWVRALSWSLTETLAASSQPITLPGNGDTLVWLGASSSEADLLLLTHNGRWTRFPIGMIPPGGCQGIGLDSGDEVVSALVLVADRRGDKPAVLCVGVDGALFAVDEGGLEAHKKPGAKAASLIRRFIALACFAVSPRKVDAVLTLSNQGEFQVIHLKGLPIASALSTAQPLHLAGRRLVAATLL